MPVQNSSVRVGPSYQRRWTDYQSGFGSVRTVLSSGSSSPLTAGRPHWPGSRASGAPQDWHPGATGRSRSPGDGDKPPPVRCAWRCPRRSASADGGVATAAGRRRLGGLRCQWFCAVVHAPDSHWRRGQDTQERQRPGALRPGQPDAGREHHPAHAAVAHRQALARSPRVAWMRLFGGEIVVERRNNFSSGGRDRVESTTSRKVTRY